MEASFINMFLPRAAVWPWIDKVKGDRREMFFERCFLSGRVVEKNVLLLSYFYLMY